MEEEIKKALEASRLAVKVRSELAAPSPEHIPLIDLEQVDSIEMIRALLPERTTLFREIFVDFVEVVRAFSPDAICVVRGLERPFDLVFQHDGESYLANHIRTEGTLGHLDSFDQARNEDLILAVRAAEALYASIPVMDWKKLSEGQEVPSLSRFEIHHIQQSPQYGTWIAGAAPVEEGTTWVRSIIPYELITQDPFLPLVIIGQKMDDEGRQKSFILEGSGGDLVFAV